MITINRETLCSCNRSHMSVKTTWFTRADSLGQNSGCMPDHCPVQARADYSVDTVVRKPVVHLMTRVQRVQEEQSLQDHDSPDIICTVPEQSASRGKSQTFHDSWVSRCTEHASYLLMTANRRISVFLDPWKTTEKKKQNQQNQSLTSGQKRKPNGVRQRIKGNTSL